MAKPGNQPRKPVLRADYQPPAWLVEEISLVFELDRSSTRIRSTLNVRRNPASGEARAPLTLDGVDLETESVVINGEEVSDKEMRLDGETLVLAGLPDQARVDICVRVKPEANTALEGLYASGDMLLTQCEAEGFRKITWFPDRPDVMARYRVRLEGDRDRYPVLLSNGNLVSNGALSDGRHFAEWEDPYPKPSYLFALVAGDLGSVEDEFVTTTGRRVALKIYSERDNLARLDHAMDSLKRSMAWDEERFGLEYDLDVYHIVATHDFNMGAMENKSLNIFNARYVLADSETATDNDFLGIEAVIAHEYFHNWTGNRVTCRDWFQLTLKEGLTVFRDQEFSADMHSRPVKRIEDVGQLRQRQFPEDAGPMAHSVRPERYMEINNFYTATVYEKGAEIVRMYQALLGREGFRRGLDLYFERHDGQAVTCDDFLAAMADANDRDLEQFGRWYRQVGTPVLEARTVWMEDERIFELRLAQSLPDRHDNKDLGPLLIPLAVGLLDEDGRSLPVTLEGEDTPGPESRLLEVSERRQIFRFAGLKKAPLISLLREFSAPVRLEYEWSDEDLARLLAFDRDSVVRWDAGRRLAVRALERTVCAIREQRRPPAPLLLETAWSRILDDESLDPGLAATLLRLPDEVELAELIEPVDVQAIHQARTKLLAFLASRLQKRIRARLAAMESEARAWSMDADAVARRRLGNTLMGLLAWLRNPDVFRLIAQRYRSADNMTDTMAALVLLVHHGAPEAEAALGHFESRWKDNALVMDKWFAVQATRPAEAAVENVAELMKHPAFSMMNPNKVRALIGSLAARNPLAFHRPDGKGYEFVAEQILALDSINPQVASRMVSVFNRWRRYPQAEQSGMQKALETIAAKKGLSPDVEEIVSTALEGK